MTISISIPYYIYLDSNGLVVIINMFLVVYIKTYLACRCRAVQWVTLSTVWTPADVWNMSWRPLRDSFKYSKAWPQELHTPQKVIAARRLLYDTWLSSLTPSTVSSSRDPQTLCMFWSFTNTHTRLQTLTLANTGPEWPSLLATEGGGNQRTWRR